MFFSIFASLTLDNSHFLQNILSSNIITITKLCVTIIIIVIIIIIIIIIIIVITIRIIIVVRHIIFLFPCNKTKMKSENVRKNGFALCMFDHFLS